MRPHRRTFQLAALALLLACAAPAQAERKALVVGNAAYADEHLKNPGHDAADLQARLQALGFSVELVQDADQQTLEDALNRFGQRLGADDDAVFFYAGHGAQNEGVNYLIPLHANIAENADLKYKAVDLGLVLDKLGHARNGFKLAIIDACRNKPYARGLRDASRGLARMDVPSGTLLWFATEPGKTAQDGQGRNSPFTEQLLQALRQPGLNNDAVFRKTHDAVAAATAGAQKPYPEGITKEFVFADGPAPVAKPAATAPDPLAVELSIWEGIKTSDNPADFEEYLKQYPQGRFAVWARNKLKRLQVAAAAPPPAAEPPAATKPPPAPAPAVKPPPKPLMDLADFGIEMVKIPGGTLQMGCGPKDGECFDDEKPRHEVSVRGFALAKTETTQGQWRALMGANPSSFKNCGDNCPVESVSFDDAQDFIAQLNEKTGQACRLPTEAEWEYAARGGTDSAYWWGEGIGNNHANCDGCGSAWDNKQPAPVASFQPNPFGLYDTAGNVWEWTADCWHRNYDNAPKDGAAWLDSAGGECKDRVLRGGSWYHDPRYARAAYRRYYVPGVRPYGIGFRVVCASPIVDR